MTFHTERFTRKLAKGNKATGTLNVPAKVSLSDAVSAAPVSFVLGRRLGVQHRHDADANSNSNSNHESSNCPTAGAFANPGGAGALAAVFD